MKPANIIRRLLAAISGALGVYVIASIKWNYVFSHPINSSKGVLATDVAVASPFLIFSYLLARRQYRRLALFGCIMGGLFLPWLTAPVFRYTRVELLRPDYGEVSETYRVFHSGFPIPFMEGTDIGMSIRFQWSLFWMDALFWALALWFAGYCFLRWLRSRRRKVQAQICRGANRQATREG